MTAHLNPPFHTALKQLMEDRVELPCLCKEHPRLGLTGEVPPSVICRECLKTIGWISADEWPIIKLQMDLTNDYMAATWRLRNLAIEHRDWRIIMTDPTAPSPLESHLNQLRSNPAVVQTVPGHILYSTPGDASLGVNCIHRWIISDDSTSPPIVKCLLCEGERQLTPEEVAILEHAEAAGVVFLKWPERLSKIRNLIGGSATAPDKTTRRAARRAARRAGGLPATERMTTGMNTSNAVESAAAVPAGFISVKDAADKLGIEPKRLRKMIRNHVYEGVKVNGLVYVKLDHD